MSDPLLCTIAETAALLHVSTDTVKRSIRSGLIPAKRLRCTLRISRAWVDAFVAESAPMLLSRRQVSRKLGVSCESVRTLQRKGLLTTVMIGTQQRIPVASIDEYLKRNSYGFLRSNRRVPEAPRDDHPASVSPRPAHPVGSRPQWSNVRGV
jgi:excisionase family DNA binding protein